MSWRSGSKLPIGMVAAVLLLVVGPANAQSVQDQKLMVQAIVGDACEVTAAALDFGSEYDHTAIVPATGSIDITCVGSTTVQVALGGGQAGNGNGIRTMRNDNNADLRYQLYTDTPGGSTWNVDTTIVEQTIASSGSVPVYGTISPSLNTLPEPGIYTDEVIITLTFL